MLCIIQSTISLLLVPISVSTKTFLPYLCSLRHYLYTRRSKPKLMTSFPFLPRDWLFLWSEVMSGQFERSGVSCARDSIVW